MSTRAKRTPGRTQILSSTPEKNKIEEAARKKAEKRPAATNKPVKRRLSKKKNQENIEPDIQTDEEDFNLDYDELYRPPEPAKRPTVPVVLVNKPTKKNRGSKRKNQENIQPDIHYDENDVAMAEVNRPTQPTTRSDRKVIAKVRTSL